MPSPRTPLGRPRILAAVAAAVILQITYIGGLILAARNPLTQLRIAFVHDQLGYMAMSSDVREGFFSLVEPLTRTGVNHYPPLYYDGVGLLARLTGSTVVTAWNLIGFTLQTLLVLALSLVISSLSGRWWVGLLAPAPLMMGTFSAFTGESWYSSIGDSHAVLWGPFGELFSKNAGSGGIVVGLTVVAVLFWVFSTEHSPRTRWRVTYAGAAVIGLLSAWQTYSFLIFAYLMLTVCAAIGIRLSTRRRAVAGASVVLLAVVWFAGPAVAGGIGQLPTMVFGLLPALPGVVVAAVATRGKLAIAIAIGAAVSLPQIAWTLSGVLGHDPFLHYRVESSHDLGVPLLQAVLRASPALIPLVAALVLAVRLGDAVVTTATSAALVCLPLLALNDDWGANAEPYRFWIAGYAIAGVVALLAWARLSARLGAEPGARPRAESGARPGPLRIARRGRTHVAITLVTTALLWTASVRDLVQFNFSEEGRTTWSPSTSREQAIRLLADRAQQLSTTDLLTTDNCIDPRTTKVNSSERIAYYHEGMAWPAQKTQIDLILAARGRAELDLTAMRAAHVGWVLTDSRCDSQFGVRYEAYLQLAGAADFVMEPDEVVMDRGAGTRSGEQSGTIRLWKLIG